MCTKIRGSLLDRKQAFKLWMPKNGSFHGVHWHRAKVLLLCFFPTKDDVTRKEQKSCNQKRCSSLNPSSGTLWSHRATSRWSGVRPPLTEMSSMTKGRLSKGSAVEKNGSLHLWHLPTSTESNTSKKGKVEGSPPSFEISGSPSGAQAILGYLFSLLISFVCSFIGYPFQVRGAMCEGFPLISSRSLVQRFLGCGVKK